MNEKFEYISIGSLIVCFDILIAGIGFMVYIEKSKIVALSGIPIVLFVFIFGIGLIVNGVKNRN